MELMVKLRVSVLLHMAGTNIIIKQLRKKRQSPRARMSTQCMIQSITSAISSMTSKTIWCTPNSSRKASLRWVYKHSLRKIRRRTADKATPTSCDPTLFWGSRATKNFFPTVNNKLRLSQMRYTMLNSLYSCTIINFLLDQARRAPQQTSQRYCRVKLAALLVKFIEFSRIILRLAGPIKVPSNRSRETKAPNQSTRIPKKLTITFTEINLPLRPKIKT